MSTSHARQPDGRTRHYGEFYGLDPVPTDLPLWLVLGNCQAEALRVMLDTVPDAPFRTVRMPPVHELESADLVHLTELAGRASVLLAQPVRDDYRDLPIGTSQVAALLPDGARVVRWPVFRYSGLYPFQVIVRHPSDPSATPTGAPYHDLRTVLAAHIGMTDAEVPTGAVVANAEASIAELARRERRDCDVAVSDVVTGFGAEAAHTINHPGNPVLLELATRVLGAAGVDAAPTDPGRVLLDSVHTPLEADVVEALSLGVPPRPDWTIGGETVAAAEIERQQLQWYEEHPVFVDAALTRHADTLDLLFPGAVR
jgi:hypothetical protein